MGSSSNGFDSDIAEAVMGTMMAAGILVLPIHDSFIAQREKRDRLERVMKEAYREMMWGFDIEVKEETLV